MTTIAQRRDELAAALAAAGIATTNAPGAVQAPCAILIQGGSDLEGIGRGQVAFAWRIVLAAGAPTVEASADELDDLMGATCSVLRVMDGWRISSIGGAGIRDVAGSFYLSADVTASAMIDL